MRLRVSTAFINLCGFFGSYQILFLAAMTLPLCYHIIQLFIQFSGVG